MKSKKGMNDVIATILIILLTVVAVIVVYQILKPVLLTPTYNITKTVCHNQTEVIGIKIIGYSNVTYPYSISYYDYHKENIKYTFGSTEDNIKINHPDCVTDYCEYPPVQGNSRGIIIEKKNFTQVMANEVPITRINHVCEDKEVEKVENIYTYCWNYFNKSEINFVSCSILQDNYFTDKDIKDFLGLEEYCQCSTPKCQVYNCGEYKVEIK